MTEHIGVRETINLNGTDLDASQSRLEKSQMLGYNSYPEWVTNSDNNTSTFAQRLAKAANFSEDVDNVPTSGTDTGGGLQDNFDQDHQLTSHPTECLCMGCFSVDPTIDSFYAGAIGNRKVVSPDTRPYNVTLKNIDPRIVSAIIGKKGAVHKQLVREFYLKTLHISKPEIRVLDSGRTISRSNIIIIGHNREKLMEAIRKIVSILKHEEELYIEIDYMDYRTHQKDSI